MIIIARSTPNRDVKGVVAVSMAVIGRIMQIYSKQFTVVTDDAMPSSRVVRLRNLNAGVHGNYSVG